MWLAKIPFSIIAEWMCFIASILLIRQASPKFWKWFIPYLAITVAIESFSFFVNRVLHFGLYTQWLYNLFFLIYMVFHIYIFYQIIALPFIKNVGRVCLLLLIGCYIWDWNSKGFNVSFSTANTLFNGVMIVLSILYFYSLFQEEEPRDILKEPAFWFVTGCLVFYATSTCVSAFFDEIVAYSKKNNFPLRYVIMNFLNIIMYGCWIKSFLCLYRDRAFSRQLY